MLPLFYQKMLDFVGIGLLFLVDLSLIYNNVTQSADGKIIKSRLKKLTTYRPWLQEQHAQKPVLFASFEYRLFLQKSFPYLGLYHVIKSLTFVLLETRCPLYKLPNMGNSLCRCTAFMLFNGNSKLSVVWDMSKSSVK